MLLEKIIYGHGRGTKSVFSHHGTLLFKYASQQCDHVHQLIFFQLQCVQYSDNISLDSEKPISGTYIKNWHFCHIANKARIESKSVTFEYPITVSVIGLE